MSGIELTHGVLKLLFSVVNLHPFSSLLYHLKRPLDPTPPSGRWEEERVLIWVQVEPMGLGFI